MPEYVKKSVPFFFSTNDEHFLETELKKRLPSVCFVDGSLWESNEPNAKDSFSACQSDTVFIWDKNACPQLPFITLADGRFRGPTSGVVIQFSRSTLRNDVLVSGDMGIGYEKNNTAIAQFVKATWQVASAMNSASLYGFDRVTGKTLDQGITDYIVGAGAKKLSQQGTLLKHCAVEVYYKVE